MRSQRYSACEPQQTVYVWALCNSKGHTQTEHAHARTGMLVAGTCSSGDGTATPGVSRAHTHTAKCWAVGHAYSLRARMRICMHTNTQIHIRAHAQHSREQVYFTEVGLLEIDSTLTRVWCGGDSRETPHINIKHIHIYMHIMTHTNTCVSLLIHSHSACTTHMHR